MKYVIIMAKNHLEKSKATPHSKSNYNIHESVVIHGGEAYLDLTGGLVIEKNVKINEGVVIYTHNHHYAYKDWRTKPHFDCPLLIREDVWIGRNAMIMPGVRTIGKGCIIAPGAVLTKSTAVYEMWGGNPAKWIKMII